MQARRYRDEDFKEIASWALDGYGTTYERSQFPKTGFIVDGLAAYFLYSTDSSVCFLENLISNKNADPQLRTQALSLVIEAALKEARDLGFTVAYATTGIPKVIVRAMQCGAVPVPKQTLLIKKL